VGCKNVLLRTKEALTCGTIKGQVLIKLIQGTITGVHVPIYIEKLKWSAKCARVLQGKLSHNVNKYD
jgi:hypothetical protein